MAKFTPDAVLDVLGIKYATATRLSICSGQPTTFAEIAALQLGSYAMTPGDGNGDFTLANGDVSGRKVIVGAQSGNNATASGNGNHAVLDDGVTLLNVTTVPTKATILGDPLTTAAYDIELRDPT